MPREKEARQRSEGESDRGEIPAVVCTISSKGDATRAREDVAFRNSVHIKGSGSAGAPVNVVGTRTSLENDLPVRLHIQSCGCAEDPDGIRDGASVVHTRIQDEISRVD